MNRYQKQIQLKEIGSRGQSLISNARVVVVGAGGLGSSVLQNLVAAGLGNISIIDDDTVAADNLHRQMIYNEDQIGSPKVNAAKKSLQKLNSTITIRPIEKRLNEKNANLLLRKHDVIVDCSDNITTRHVINELSVELQIPFVYAAIHGFEGQVSVFNYKGGPTYCDLFPQDANNSISNCDDSGVLGTIPSIMGSLQATETLKIILQNEHVLSGKLMIYDLLKNTNRTYIIRKSKNVLKTKKYTKQLKPNIMEISSTELAERLFLNQELQIIDIRDENSVPVLTEIETACIPFHQIESAANSLSSDVPIILICQNGNKSKAASQLLNKINPDLKIYSLTGGVKTIVNEEVKELA
ncbi:MAG: hypothetical protein HKN22_02865 [Bacteroidia bacterium]|nr:hypothetical protein [Bacteroidia bacterium]